MPLDKTSIVVHIELDSDGSYLATSSDVPNLIATGFTLDEVFAAVNETLAALAGDGSTPTATASFKSANAELVFA